MADDDVLTAASLHLSAAGHRDLATQVRAVRDRMVNRELLRHALEVAQSAPYVHDVCGICHDIAVALEFVNHA